MEESLCQLNENVGDFITQNERRAEGGQGERKEKDFNKFRLECWVKLVQAPAAVQ